MKKAYILGIILIIIGVFFYLERILREPVMMERILDIGIFYVVVPTLLVIIGIIIILVSVKRTKPSK